MLTQKDQSFNGATTKLTFRYTETCIQNPFKMEAVLHNFSLSFILSLQQLTDRTDKVEADEENVDESIAPNVPKKADSNNLFEDEMTIKDLQDQSKKKDEAAEVIVSLNTESSIAEKTPIAPPDERNITVTAIKSDDTKIEISKEKDVKVDETDVIYFIVFACPI